MAVPLIHNPRSGGGRGARIAKKAASLLAHEGLDTQEHQTTGPMDAGDIAMRLAKEGHDLILVLGGDGTLSEAVDGILRSGHAPTLGLLPGGTGNSLLRDFGEPSLEAGVKRIAARGEHRALDAARVRWANGAHERHFVNVFGTGFMAKVCDLANRHYKWMGSASYTWSVFPELTRLRSPPTRLILDGRTIEENLPLVAVCNSIHTGGAMKIAPMAKTDDGWLDVIALREVDRRELLSIFPKIFNGTHIGHERVLVERARTIRIEPSEPSPLLGDGEVYGQTPCDIEVMPGALRVLV